MTKIEVIKWISKCVEESMYEEYDASIGQPIEVDIRDMVTALVNDQFKEHKDINENDIVIELLNNKHWISKKEEGVYLIKPYIIYIV